MNKSLCHKGILLGKKEHREINKQFSARKELYIEKYDTVITADISRIYILYIEDDNNEKYESTYTRISIQKSDGQLYFIGTLICMYIEVPMLNISVVTI